MLVVSPVWRSCSSEICIWRPLYCKIAYVVFITCNIISFWNESRLIVRSKIKVQFHDRVGLGLRLSCIRGSARKPWLLDTGELSVGGSLIRPVTVARDLGVMLQSDLSMKDHVARPVSRCFRQLRLLKGCIKISAFRGSESGSRSLRHIVSRSLQHSARRRA